MKLKDGVNMSGLSLVMRHVLVAAEQIWLDEGRSEGVTVTSALDGEHSASSWHYYGYALDFRIRYFDKPTQLRVYIKLRKQLDNKLFDVVLHDTHIHVEYDPKIKGDIYGVN